jgi:alkylated DNA repair dioxygenase AlkB
VLGSLSQVVTEGVRSSGVTGAECFSANEVMYQRYRTGDGGISAHRDQSFYRAAVVVFTLEGRAPFAVLDPGTGAVSKEWVTEPGDMCLLAGGGLTDRDRRPRHRVGPPLGSTRVSLTIRMKDQ